MASSSSFLGPLISILHKEGIFNLGSSLFQRTLIDAVNLVFIFILFVQILLAICSQGSTRIRGRRKNWFSLTVSICCTLLSIVYFSLAFWEFISHSEGTKTLFWQVYIFRGVIWVSLAISVIIQLWKSIEIVKSIWWASLFVLVSVVNIELLIRRDFDQVLDYVQWPASGLLLVCALKFPKEEIGMKLDPNNELSESLLHEKEEVEKPNFGIISGLSFFWLNPLLRLGYSKPLVFEDIPSLFSDDEASVSYKKFNETWQELTKEVSSRNMVIRTLAKVYMKEIICVGFVALLRTICVVISPLLLYAFVTYSSHDHQNLNDGLVLLGCLVIVKVIESLSQRQWAFHARRSGMRMRSALMVAIYHKELRLSSLGKKKHSSGEIVNYIMVDAYRMGELAWWFHSSWTLPLQLIIAIGVLIGVVGFGALPALLPLLVCGVLNYPFARSLQNCQAKSMEAQDKRLRSTSEILNNMKIIKLQSWEEHFLKVVYSLRGDEFKWLKDAQHNIANCTALFWLSPTVISSFAFWGCTYFNNTPLDAVTLFTILATLAIVAEPVVMLPNVFSSMIQVMVSFDRINNFLLEDEVKVKCIEGIMVSQDYSVQIHEGNFSWDDESTFLSLRDINLVVKLKKKIAICGPVGGGKSSLLYAILGEIPKISGSVDVFGSVAYVSQSSWIQSGTIRDNILYGEQMVKDRYEKAIKACALAEDIENFSHGDLTEIGQRGLNLSGGQKQRIQLARAVYSDADIYLLDDPFSAVDALTSATLFNECVMGALHNKTVILVTHQVEFLSQVDKILVMENGQVIQCGIYDNLLKSGMTFEKLVNAHRKAVTQLDPSSSDQNREIQSEQDQTVFTEPSDSETKISTKHSPGQLTEDEEKEVGDYGWKPYLDYINVSKSKTAFCLSVIAQCAFVAFQAASRYWLAFAIEIPKISSGVLIGVYAGLSTLGIVFVHIRSLCTVQFGLNGSRAFFEGFMNSIFHAPMLFFDSTPVGRILTRLSSDLSVLDFEIPFGIAYAVAGATELLGIIVVMSLVTWQVLIIGILTLIGAKYFQDRYLASAREIMRINGTTKAPIMNYAAETSQGVITIRAFEKVDPFFDNYLKLVDNDAKLFFYSNVAMEWLLLRIDTLQNITLFTASFLLILLPKDFVPPGFVGLSLSYALSLKGTNAFMTQFYCKVSNHIISAERIKQFMDIKSEPQAIIPGNRPPPSWPSKGRINLDDLKIKYQSNAPLVLKGITCTFKEGSRIGVVGRTGSGKTTLISALFRLVEPHSGRIYIDGIDICSIGLKDLRTKLSIIPQEPTLFQGSIRSNLDPLGLYADSEIWEALEKCQLQPKIKSLPNQLDSQVGDEGGNWSMGQRQLFCLGRILLKRNKILVLDEATASIDSTTDAILQKIIREEFSSCTVITVAHRVPTVIDSDMVMVLSFGEHVEYDEPNELIKRNSVFAKLVAEYWSSCNKNSSTS